MKQKSRLKKRSRRRFKRNLRKRMKMSWIVVLYLIFIILLVFSGMKIYNWFKENKYNKDIIDKIDDYVIVDDENETIEIDFDKLLQINSDTIGWIRVNGTNINYPVVKTSDNSYYLTHSFDKTTNSTGWVFADYRNKIDETDRNIVLYAHNRKDKSMFGSLSNVLKSDWLSNEDNFILYFSTISENKKYRVFSVYKVLNEDYYITTSFSGNEFIEFITTIKGRSIYNFGVDVTENDNIITLSTCASNDKYRIVLHAKEIKDTE